MSDEAPVTRAGSSWVNGAWWLLTLQPWLCLLLLYSLVLRARLQLGFWPQAGHLDRVAQPEFPYWVASPLDPRVFHLHYQATWILLLATLPMVLPWFGLTAIHLWRAGRAKAAQPWVYAVGFSLLVIQIVLDPLGFQNWFVD